MQVDFLTTLITVLMMVALCLPTFILRKLNRMPEKAVSVMVTLLIYVAQPFLTFSSFLSKEYNSALLINMLIIFGISMFVHVLFFLLTKLLFMFCKDAPKRSASEVSSFLGNIGFMGIPIIKAFFPGNSEMLMYTAVFTIGFQISGWTLGVFNITHNKKDISFKRAFLNPAVAVLIIALPLFFFKSKIPVAIFDNTMPYVDYIGNMTLPLSMFIVGVRLAEIKFKSLFTSLTVFIAVFFKLIIAPLITFCFLLLFKHWGVTTEVLLVVFVSAAMPAASLSLSLLEIFGGDRETGVKINILSTVLSALTIPIIMLLSGFL